MKRIAWLVVTGGQTQSKDEREREILGAYQVWRIEGDHWLHCTTGDKWLGPLPDVW